MFFWDGFGIAGVMFHVWCGGIIFLWSLLHLFLLPFPQCELLDPLGLLRRSTPMRPLHTIVTSPANCSIPWQSMEPWLGSCPTTVPFTSVDFLIFFSFLLPPIWESTFTFIHIEFFFILFMFISDERVLSVYNRNCEFKRCMRTCNFFHRGGYCYIL